MKLATSFLLIFVLLAGAAVAQSSSFKAEEGMKQADLAGSAATLKNGADGFASMFAADGVILRGRLIQGPEQIAATNRKFYQDGNMLQWHPTFAHAAASGELGYTIGDWEITKTGESKASGQYITVFKKQADGSFQAMADTGGPGRDTVPFDPTLKAAKNLRRAERRSDTSKSGDVKYSVGEIEGRFPDPKTSELQPCKGTYLQIWTRKGTSAEWKLAADITAVAPVTAQASN